MFWKKLVRFREPHIAKLFNLRRAALAGLSVPPTVWVHAANLDIERSEPPNRIQAPWIIRSASPTEDSDNGTAAGQFVTREVLEAGAFQAALREVVESLPRDASGVSLGAVFVQPLVTAELGGVVFFDGFSFECTTATEGNRKLTAGSERGMVERGHLRRGDPFSNWLGRLSRVYRRELASGAALDVEFLRDGDSFTLLQARPARFEVRRDPLLSLANHREILGDPPSPWIVSALELAGASALDYFVEIDPEVGRWNERYALTVAGRSWLNFTFFFRLMDHWGLPRTFVTEGVGGESEGPLDARIDFWRMLCKAPRLLRLQLKNMLTVFHSTRELSKLEQQVREAKSVRELFDVTVLGLGVALRTNFAINGALTGVVRVRRALGIRGRARVKTEEMMNAYDALRSVDPEQLGDELDDWIARFGHRGPLESDPARPRFAELREILLTDLMGAGGSSAPETRPDTTSPSGGGLLFALDRKREAFRDDLMRVWEILRASVLEAAKNEGFERLSDVFLLEHADFDHSSRPDLVARKAELERLTKIELPTTATRSAIERSLESPPDGAAEPSDTRVFRGVALSKASFEGRVQRAKDLIELLQLESRLDRPLLDAQTVLVVPALEPSWSVVFGRVGAVVTELGGELSHASILLREARKPAIVNCPGVFAALVDGERVRLDGERGVLERVLETQRSSVQ
ncbi:MAG: phosphohistidine swiveling domain-containing protein [Planctomycetota bacterium]|jgi:phosphohistidine swiveling domain-containing protein